MSKTVRHLLALLLQLAVTAGALFFVFHDENKRSQMAQSLAHADWRWLAAAAAAFGAVEALAVLRWKLLLDILGFPVSWGRATAQLLISEFFITFTPGLVGGDAMRIYYLIREHPEKKVDAAMAVLMDRLLGMASLIVIAIVLVASRYGWMNQTPVAAGLLNTTILILAGGAAAMILPLLVAKSGVFSRMHLPGRVVAVGSALQRFAADRGRTAAAFMTTLVAHGFYYASFCWAAVALARPGQPGASFWDVFCVMPIVNTLTALPISLAGIGLRESLFQRLLHDLAGAPESMGVLIGALGFAIRALWSLPGAVAWLCYRRPAKARSGELTGLQEMTSG